MSDTKSIVGALLSIVAAGFLCGAALGSFVTWLVLR